MDLTKLEAIKVWAHLQSTTRTAVDTMGEEIGGSTETAEAVIRELSRRKIIHPVTKRKCRKSGQWIKVYSVDREMVSVFRYEDLMD